MHACREVRHPSPTDVPHYGVVGLTYPQVAIRPSNAQWIAQGPIITPLPGRARACTTVRVFSACIISKGIRSIPSCAQTALSPASLTPASKQAIQAVRHAINISHKIARPQLLPAVHQLLPPPATCHLLVRLGREDADCLSHGKVLTPCCSNSNLEYSVVDFSRLRLWVPQTKCNGLAQMALSHVCMTTALE